MQAALQYVKLQRRTDAAALAFSSLFLGNLLDGAGVAAVRCQKKALARADGAVGVQTRIASQYRQSEKLRCRRLTCFSS